MGAIWEYFGSCQRDGGEVLQQMEARLSPRVSRARGICSGKGMGMGMEVSGKASVGREPGVLEPIPFQMGGGQLVLGVNGNPKSPWKNLLLEYEKKAGGFLRGRTEAFALALFDSKEPTLLLARDPFGQKPLFYTGRSDGVFFSSEIKTLLPFLPERVVDEESLCEYLSFQAAFEERSFYKGLHRIRPGWIHRFDREGRVKKEPFWEPPEKAKERELEGIEEALLTALRTSVDRAVGENLSAGISLSGGIDSTAIGVLASEKVCVRTFTGAFKEGDAFDETPYARAASRRMDARYHLILPTPSDFMAHFFFLLRMLEEPVGGPGSFPQLLVSKAASEHVPILLSGEGGDELFGGYARYTALRVHEALCRGVEGKTSQEWEGILLGLRELRGYERLLEELFRLPLSSSRGERYFHLVYRGSRIAHLLSGEMARSIQAFDPRVRSMERYAPLKNLPSLEGAMRFDQFHLLPGLLHIDDRISLACGIEVQAPFLFPNVVDLALRIPSSLLFLEGRSKGILRTSLKGVIPEEIRLREDKKGFPVPLHLWVKGPLREFTWDLLLGKKARERRRRSC